MRLIRSLSTYNDVRKKTIVLDFDGVINDYSGWKGEGHLGKPIPGFREFLDKANREGYIVVVHSASDSTSVEKWLKKYNFECPVMVEKPAGCVYVDDNALLFEGSFTGLLDKIKQHKPWWEKEE